MAAAELANMVAMDMQDLISNFHPRPGFSRRSEMAAYLRELIVSGKVAAGTKLPPTLELAKACGSHAPAVQAAMNALVKEGLVLRLMGRGTFVRDAAGDLRKVALYVPGGRRVANNFAGHLMRMLEEQLSLRGVRSESWISRRSETLAEQPWEELVAAAKRREIQGVIVPVLEPREVPWLIKLPVPVAFLATEHLPNRVELAAWKPAMDSALAHLASQGCRSIGLITVLSRLAEDVGGDKAESVKFFERFFQLAKDHGLQVQESWIQSPPVELPEKAAARFGYDSFHQLWNQPEKPDALFVYTDVAAQGVLMALGQRQVRVPDELRLVLHRNAEMGLFCPVPASFIDVNVQKVASALVDLLQRLCRGESVAQPMTVEAEFVPESVAAGLDAHATTALAG